MKKYWKINTVAVLSFLLLLISPGCGLFNPLVAGGPYRGRVIDTDTRQPLEGAAVLAVWYSVTPTIADQVDAYLDAEEVLTDRNGRFVVGKHPPRTWRPGWVEGPSIFIFYPGFGSYPEYHAAPPLPLGGTGDLLEMMEKGELTIELRRLATREERLRVIRGALPLSVPRKKIPHLMRMINQESRAVGIPGYDS